MKDVKVNIVRMREVIVCDSHSAFATQEGSTCAE